MIESVKQLSDECIATLQAENQEKIKDVRIEIEASRATLLKAISNYALHKKSSAKDAQNDIVLVGNAFSHIKNLRKNLDRLLYEQKILTQLTASDFESAMNEIGYDLKLDREIFEDSQPT